MKRYRRARPSHIGKVAAGLAAALLALGSVATVATLPARAGPAIAPTKTLSPSGTRAEKATNFHNNRAPDFFCGEHFEVERSGLAGALDPEIWEENRLVVGFQRELFLPSRGISGVPRKRCREHLSHTFVSMVRFDSAGIRPPSGEEIKKAVLTFKVSNPPGDRVRCTDAISLAIMPLAPWEPGKVEVDGHARPFPNRGARSVEGIADTRGTLDITAWARLWARGEKKNTGVAFYPEDMRLKRGREFCAAVLSDIELHVVHGPRS